MTTQDSLSLLAIYVVYRKVNHDCFEQATDAMSIYLELYTFSLVSTVRSKFVAMRLILMLWQV